MRKSLSALALGLALCLAMLTDVPRPAQAAPTSISVTANGVGANVSFFDFTNPADVVIVEVFLIPLGEQALPAPNYFMFYEIFDQQGLVNDFGGGFLPGSDVSISGGSPTAGKTIVKLNVDTCGLPTTGQFAFTTFSGPCGVFDITWTEVAVFEFGLSSFRGTTTFTFPGGKMVEDGTTVSRDASVTGSALGFFSSPNSFGSISQSSNVVVTFTAP